MGHFAVFVHKVVAPVFGVEVGGAARHFEEWLSGWFCSPLSRYFVGLEEAAAFSLGELVPDANVPGSSEEVVCKWFRSHGMDAPDVRFAHGCDEKIGEVVGRPAEHSIRQI